MTRVDSKFLAFNKSEAVYKNVSGCDIRASVFVPKEAKAGVLPVHVRWHGGALLIGARDYEPWFPTWIIDLAAQNSAILVTPDYRLLPESPGSDILEDLHAFYTWLHDSLPSHLATYSPTHSADLTRILITGESAGGYMATQSALLLSPNIPGLKAVIAQYPMLDLRAPHYSVPGRKNVWGRPAPDLPKGWLERKLEVARRSDPVTNRIPGPNDPDLFVALLEAGRYTEVLGERDELFPMENLEVVGRIGGMLPPLWIVHGGADTVVPLEGTLRFVGKAKEVLGLDVPVTVVEGVEHGFDKGVGLDEGWVREGSAWLSGYWP